MILADFLVTVTYTQVLVQTEDAAAGGLLWTDDHVAQGFAWSDGFVSFGVPDHDGECRIEVELTPDTIVAPQALWGVQVPFNVTGPLQIGTVLNTRSVVVPRGSYQLTYQALAGNEDYAYIVRLTFSQSSAPEFRILKNGGDITANTVLRCDAELAK